MDLHKEELAQAKRAFGQWRRERKHRERIPSALWDQACRCAGLMGRSQVAVALGLNHHQLKLAMEERQSRPQCLSKALAPMAVERESRPRVTVTKIVSLESPDAATDHEGWNVVSPDGWKFSAKGRGCEQALRAFVETVTRCGVRP